MSIAGLFQEQLIFEVDYTDSFEDMVAAGNYDWRIGNLNTNYFPFEGEGKKLFEAKLFDADCYSNVGITRIAEADQVQPWNPAKIEHVLKFGVNFPRLQLKHPIVGLGSSSKICDGVFAPCLDRCLTKRSLVLAYLTGHFAKEWRLLGVREILAQ